MAIASPFESRTKYMNMMMILRDNTGGISSSNSQKVSVGWVGSGAVRYLAGVICMVGLMLAGGCGDQGEVTTYVDTYNPTAADTFDSKSEKHQRVLAAIVPDGHQLWFIKLMGRADRIAKHVDAFRFVVKSFFIDSSEAHGGVPHPHYSVPEGWKEDKERGKESAFPRETTFVFGEGDEELEMTITSNLRQRILILGDVNRWRGQVGLGKINREDIPHFVEINLDGGMARYVCDFTGPGGQVGGMGRGRFPSGHPNVHGGIGNSGRPPKHLAKPDVTGDRPELTHTAPEGWKNSGSDSTNTRLYGYELKDGDKSVMIKITPLKGTGGGAVANANIWRVNVKLPKIGRDEVEKALKPIQVDDTTGQYIDWSGPATDDAGPQRVVGVIVERGSFTWFIKMIGDTELVDKQVDAFRKLVASIKFKK